MPAPPPFEVAVVSVGGKLSPLEPVVFDKETDIAILRLKNNPFPSQRSLRWFLFVHKDEHGNPVGKPEPAKDQNWVPAIASEFAPNGENVIRVGFAYNVLPELDYSFGHITRSAFLNGRVTLHTSLPFKETDCGAPIINNAKTVIGMLNGVDPETGTTANPLELAVPSKYILDLLAKSASAN